MRNCEVYRRVQDMYVLGNKSFFFPDIYFDVNYSVLSVSDILMWH